jgi:hypothetical protein
MVADVTIMAWIYGENYDKYLERWSEALKNLNTKPKRIMVISDRPREIEIAEVVVIEPKPEWNVPNPHYANYVANNTDTKWLLLMDIDDMIKPDALDDLNEVEADVYLMGIDINGNEIYLPPQLSNEQIYSLPNCYFAFGSPIKREWALKFPFHDTPYGDWIFWREIARAGAKFAWSGRVGYFYRKDFENSMSGPANANPRWREEVLNNF